MPSLVIGGITVPVLEDTWTGTPTFIGSSFRGVDGSLHHVGVGERDTWSFETTLLDATSARALRAFLTPGRTLAWDFEDSSYPLYSSSGKALGPTNFGLAAGRTGTSGIFINTSVPCTYTTCVRTGVSLGFSLRSFGVWRSWWASLSPSGVGTAWLDGAPAPFSAFQTYAALTFTSFNLVAGSSITFDDVVLVTAETSFAYASAFHQRALAAQRAPFLPRLEAWGTLLRASGYGDAYKVQCRITGEKGVTARMAGALVDMTRLQVSMEQADSVK